MDISLIQLIHVVLRYKYIHIGFIIVETAVDRVPKTPPITAPVIAKVNSKHTGITNRFC